MLLLGLVCITLGLVLADPSIKARAQQQNAKRSNSKEPMEKEYLKLLAMDDLAQKEIDRWIRENQAFEAQGAGVSDEVLNARIEERLKPVRAAYENFLQKNPNHVQARLAYGSFLNDTRNEYEAMLQWEKAREADPKNPAAWNNLANFYGHRGPVKKAFEYYAKAIELDPNEAVYYHNFGTTVFLFRKDAQEHFSINEQQVFDRALELYDQALKLDPKNFLLASDIAQTYYGIKPPRTDKALAAWQYALKLASSDLERHGIYIHLARLQLNCGRFSEARKNLGLVTHETYAALKSRLNRNLLEKEKLATNALPQGVAQ